MNTLTEELLAEVEKACFEAGRDNNHDFIMERLHECAQDNAERLLNDAFDVSDPLFSLSDLPEAQYDRLVFAYKDGFWENCHVQERRDLRDALSNVTAALQTVLIHQGKHMTVEDRSQRQTLISNATAVLDRYTPPSA
jgi:hypothetical protein